MSLEGESYGFTPYGECFSFLKE